MKIKNRFTGKVILTIETLVGANLSDADLRGADLSAANLRGAKNILQWQSPLGEKRICYSVKHSDCVMHQLGCHWGDTQSTVDAIIKRYGENSLYERYVWLADSALNKEEL
mgnify:CR=1 FL=1